MIICLTQASQVALMVKNLPANAGDLRDAGSIPGSRRCPGGGHGHPLQYSCLGNPMDRGAWQATVHGVAKSPTRLSTLSICDRGGKIYNEERTTSSITSVGKNWTVTCQRIRISYSFTPCTKRDLKRMKDLNV